MEHHTRILFKLYSHNTKTGENTHLWLAIIKGYERRKLIIYDNHRNAKILLPIPLVDFIYTIIHKDNDKAWTTREPFFKKIINRLYPKYTALKYVEEALKRKTLTTKQINFLKRVQKVLANAKPPQPHHRIQ